MTDCFAVFGEPRRPWLDVEALKEVFLARSAEVHPDRYHGAAPGAKAEAGQRYTELNTAYQTLKETRARVLHLLELETGVRPRDVQRIPPGTMELFVEVGQTCRDVDEFLGRRGSVTSPMLRVKLFREGLDWVEKLKAMQGRVRERGDGLELELKGLNRAWEEAPAGPGPERAGRLPLGRLEEIYRVSSYVARWTEQLQERVVQLAAM